MHNIKDVFRKPIAYIVVVYCILLITNSFLKYSDFLVYTLGFPYFIGLFLENTPYYSFAFYSIAILYLVFLAAAMLHVKKWLTILVYFSVIINVFLGWLSLSIAKVIADAAVKAWTGN